MYPIKIQQGAITTGLLGVMVVVITHTETDDEIHFISMREAETHETRPGFGSG